MVKKELRGNPLLKFLQLYENTKKWKSQTFNSNTNLLSEIKSKKFDLTIEVDLTETTATKFGLKMANKTILYDIHNSTLLSNDLLLDTSNRIKIRILVDWGQLEVFANDGIFSLSEQFAFTSDGDDIELFTDGEIQLVSMEFHEVARTW